jgi:hypothetical protein
MNKNRTAELALSRIEALGWGEKAVPNSRDALNVLLFQEYLRRMFMWSQKLNCGKWPFFSVALCIGSQIELDQTLLNRFNKVRFPNPLVRTTCLDFLHWETIKDHTTVASIELPAPYDPLMLMYERGSDIRREENVVELYTQDRMRAVWLIKSKYDRLEPFVELDEETLDRIEKSSLGNNGE